MNKKQIKGRVKVVKARIKAATGKLVGDKAMQKKGTAEKNAAERKVLYEDLKADFRKLA
ncbi:MAG TPA: CsbD family protein [Burkholderiaceae bacterium]|nr:CsbD family protein [Burkholderiaceae bacterium]